MTAREYLIAIRQRGLTQVQIAEKTGIPQGTISKIERAQVSDVLSKTYVALRSLYEELNPQRRRQGDPTPACSLPDRRKSGTHANDAEKSAAATPATAANDGADDQKARA